MTEKDKIFDKVKKYKELHQKEYGIKRIGIFGSFVKKDSFGDVDIVVDLDTPDLFKLIGIKQDLQEELGFNVDVIRYRESMNPYLKKHIDIEAVYV
ncbi:MAG: nucleotidyltransferase [Ignavibacteria bacterium GWB2_35_6b]|nr:MAG: nucleotidyltransferase [Ignavibacteria bacterium GWB2_35_6b]